MIKKFQAVISEMTLSLTRLFRVGLETMLERGGEVKATGDKQESKQINSKS